MFYRSWAKTGSKESWIVPYKLLSVKRQIISTFFLIPRTNKTITNGSIMQSQGSRPQICV